MDKGCEKTDLAKVEVLCLDEIVDLRCWPRRTRASHRTLQNLLDENANSTKWSTRFECLKTRSFEFAVQKFRVFDTFYGLRSTENGRSASKILTLAKTVRKRRLSRLFERGQRSFGVCR